MLHIAYDMRLKMDRVTPGFLRVSATQWIREPFCGHRLINH